MTELGPVAAAEVILTKAGNGGLVAQLVEILTTENAVRGDVLLALAMIGMSLGAGAWIGWEVTKWVVVAFRKVTQKSVPRMGDAMDGRRKPRAQTTPRE